ncbi:phage anti-repressor protein [Fontibacillus solani]|uniref:Phage anti-repressor protein n=1 Tax=Fontibacillus solani TaxID=1572857 RepID=A0A7W3SVN7_9BACL|nr:antA/AntB antirepressor family protein [Fontibacillus solani]MBA9086983.1 phage anti-repressor protein [Fontibacillus solani]
MDKTLLTNELLPIYQTTDTGEKVVDARELCGFLNVGRDFTTWLKDRIEKYGFVDGEDFILTLTKTGERQNVTRHDYILKLDMAKELAMVENNEQGRKARRYFIKVEKRFKQGEPQVPLANMERAKITRLLQMLDMAEREKLFTLETESAIRKQIAEMVLGDKAVTHKELPPWEQPEPPHIRYKGRWYKSSEIAVIAGVSVNLIGQLSSKHNIRTDEYSRSVSINGDSKSGVQQILYNEKGKNELVRLAELKLASGYVPRTRKKVKRR